MERGTRTSGAPWHLSTPQRPYSQFFLYSCDLRPNLCATTLTPSLTLRPVQNIVRCRHPPYSPIREVPWHVPLTPAPADIEWLLDCCRCYRIACSCDRTRTVCSVRAGRRREQVNSAIKGVGFYFLGTNGADEGGCTGYLKKHQEYTGSRNVT